MSAATTTVSTSVLKSVPMFAAFREDQLRALVTVVMRRSAPRGSVIMAEGDRVDSLYIVISGRLKVMMGEADGKEVILGILGPGEIFGEMGLIDDGPRSAGVVAIEPCELMVVTRGDFKRCMVESFDTAMTVAERGLSSISPISPKNSPGPMMLRIASLPSASPIITLSRPDITM